MLEKEDNLQSLAALGERIWELPCVSELSKWRSRIRRRPHDEAITGCEGAEQRVILTQQAKAHPLVKQALEMFGGELAEVRTTTPAQEVQE